MSAHINDIFLLTLVDKNFGNKNFNCVTYCENINTVEINTEEKGISLNLFEERLFNIR